MISPHCSLDATKIAPRIYQGSAPPEGRAVAECGFNVLVLAAEEYQPGTFPGVRVLHAPMDDAELTRDEWTTAVRTAVTVSQAVKSGATVLITCMAGRNRSGLVTALTLHMLTSKSGPGIVRHIQNRRSMALSNPSFVRALSVL